MVDEERAYRELMALLREQLPELHAQIADEVARGREVRGTDLEMAEREGRDRRLGVGRLGRIAESDVSVYPYLDEERLDLLLTALRTSADTLARSLAALSSLLTEQSVLDRRVYFRRPESQETVIVEVPPRGEGASRPEDIAIRLGEVQVSIDADRRARGH